MTPFDNLPFDNLDDDQIHELRDDEGVELFGKSQYLSGSQTVKDDLQAVYQMQRELGQTIWTLHQLINSVNVGAGSHNTAFVTAHAALSLELGKLLEAHKELENKLASLVGAHLGTITKEVHETLEQLKAHRLKFDAMLPKLELSMASVLAANNIDPTTLQATNPMLLQEAKDAKIRRERWLNALIGAVVGLISNLILWGYASALRSDSQDSNKQIMEKIDGQVKSFKDLEKDIRDHIGAPHRK